MNKKTSILLIFGGKSTEHEVSIRSAKSVYDALDKDKYNVYPIGIAKSGAWITSQSALKALKSGKPILNGQPYKALLPDPTKTTKLISHGLSPEDRLVIFPVLHGPLGEDGTIQGVFEMANVPYVGCGVLGSAIGMDKIRQKQILEINKIPTAKFYWFKKSHWDKTPQKIITDMLRFFKNKYPVFVKPANAGSSVGITKVHDQSELGPSIKLAFKFDIKVMVEEGIENAREIETSILGNDEPEVSVCGEIIPEHEFYDYESKYESQKTELLIPAEIPQKISDQIRGFARDAFIALDMSGLARADFLIQKTTNKIYLNELNTMPGFTNMSMYPKLWESQGYLITGL